jgi:cell division protein FtsB
MPITVAEKSALEATANTIVSQVAALVVDTVDVAALEAQIASLTAERDALSAQVSTLHTKISNAQAALA